MSIWFADYQAQIWDKQIEQDLDDGRFDVLLEQVDSEYEAGKAEQL